MLASTPGKMKMPDPMIALMPMQKVSKIEIWRALPGVGFMDGCKLRRSLPAGCQPRQHPETRNDFFVFFAFSSGYAPPRK
jgi:hypothetical protein